MLSIERAVQILDFQKTFGKLVVQAEFVVQCELESGNTVPGYCLKERSSKRTWVDEASAIAVLDAEGFTEEQYFDKPSLKSPYQIEKDLKFKTGGLTLQTTTVVVVPEKSRGKDANASPESEFAA